MAIRVYHNTDGSSDKYWAISDQLDSDGNHEIWYGRRGSTLTFTTRSENKHWTKLAGEKLSNGYKERSSLTIDRHSRKVVNTTNVSDLPPMPSAVEKPNCAYFVVKPWQQELDEQLDLKSEVSAMRLEFIEAVKGFDSTLAKLDFDFLPDYSDSVENNELHCEIEYVKGPLAFLFLFALKHKLAKHSFDVLISNDDLTLNENPTKSDDLFTVVRGEWLSDNTEMPNDGIVAKQVRDACIKLADRIFFNQLCIEVGSKEAPFSLSSIEAPSKAAFF
tara:strand:+ start:3700 stop:4524 length:825 start_codon:yes stop_codon:yes gene_type:complete